MRVIVKSCGREISLRRRRTGVAVGIPDRFGAELRVVVGVAAAGSGGDGVDDLVVVEGVAVPEEVGGKIAGGLGGPRSHDETQSGVVEGAEVGGRQHPGVGDDDHLGDAVALLERADDRHDGVGRGLVPFEAADLQGEPAAVDEQPDHDLGVSPATFDVHEGDTIHEHLFVNVLSSWWSSSMV